MKCKVISHIDVGRNLKRVQNDGLWKFAAEEWWKLMTPYVPMDTGDVIETSRNPARRSGIYRTIRPLYVRGTGNGAGIL